MSVERWMPPSLAIRINHFRRESMHHTGKICGADHPGNESLRPRSALLVKTTPNLPTASPRYRRADDDARYARGNVAFGDLHGTNAAAQLHRDVRYRGSHGLDKCPVLRLAGKRAVEIDDVQPPGALLRPMPGHGHGIGGEHGRIVHAALPQAHTFALLEVDGWNQNHGLQAAFGGRHDASHTLIRAQRHAQRAAEGFEQGFGLMMGIVA